MSKATSYALGKNGTVSISLDGTAFTPIAALKSISYSGDQQSYETITNMDSPGAQDEYAPTTSTPGTAQAQGVFSPFGDPGQIMSAAARQSQVLLTVKQQMAPAIGQTKGFSRTFNAYVQECNCPSDQQYDKASTFNVTFKITGPKTDTFGS